MHSGLPISVNWTFFARCYGWGATSDYRFKIGDFAPTGVGWPKISGRMDRPPISHSFSQKTRINDLLYCIKIWTDFSFVLSQSTHLTDERTDGRTDRILIVRPRLHSMQREKAVSFNVDLSKCMTHPFPGKVYYAILLRHHSTTLLFQFGPLILILILLLGHNNL